MERHGECGRIFDRLGGCSALTWQTEEGKHLWGRNYDFNKTAQGSSITYLPRKTKFYTCIEARNRRSQGQGMEESDYGILGMGAVFLEACPIFYEGMNEKGLMGGQLYYREFAHFEENCKENTVPLQPVFAVTYLLAKCASVEEVAKQIQEEVTLIKEPILGAMATVHWLFSDRSGEALVIEPDREGIKIYRNTMGVLTNSPGYEWHCTNLLNYSHIQNKDYGSLCINGEKFRQYFSGSGALGMPGDWSSVSRFVRLAFLKEYGVKGKQEAQGVTNMFHMLEHVAFPLGMVQVGEPGPVTSYDAGISPYDYTVYTAVMCAESLRYYWASYKNRRVQYVSMETLQKEGILRQLDMDEKEDFRCRD